MSARTSTIAALALCIFAPGARAQEPRIYQPEEMQHDLALFRRALVQGHAAFVAQDTTPFGRAFDAMAMEASEPRSAVEFQSLVMRLVALLEDGHTRAFPTNATQRYLGRLGLLPFHVIVQQERLFIRRDLSEADLGDGSEVLAIDDRSMKSILRRLASHLSVDGGSRSGIEHRLGSNYNSFYRIYPQLIDARARHTLIVRDARSGHLRRMEVTALAGREFDRIERERYGEPLHTQSLEAELARPALELRVLADSGVAVLTVRRFFKDGFDEPIDAYPTLLRESFARIASAGVGRLIIDLRSNGGGIGANAAELVRYSSDSTFRPTTSITFRGNDAFYRSITTDSLQLDSYFALRPGRRGFDVTNADSIAELRTFSPAENSRYRGRVIVLIDGGTVSAAGQAAGLLQRYTAAVFVGRETGGYAGMSNGIRQLTVRGVRTDVGISFPLAHSEFSVDPARRERGVVPDVVVLETIDDIRTARDAILGAALALPR